MFPNGGVLNADDLEPVLKAAKYSQDSNSTVTATLHENHLHYESSAIKCTQLFFNKTRKYTMQKHTGHYKQTRV